MSAVSTLSKLIAGQSPGIMWLVMYLLHMTGTQCVACMSSKLKYGVAFIIIIIVLVIIIIHHRHHYDY